MSKCNYINLIVVFVVLIIMAACNGNTDLVDTPEKAKFVERTTPGIYVNGMAHFVFSEQTHQLSINTERKTFRIQTDNQSKYMRVKLDRIVDVKDYTGVSVVICSKGGEDSNKYNMQCYKTSSEMMWLWDNDNNIGIVFPVK